MYGIPIDWPPYRPEPKSGCSGTFAPMKPMIASELGSTGALAMFSFQRLSAGNGMNPFKDAPMPTDMPLQFCAGDAAGRQRITRRDAEMEMRIVRITETPAGDANGLASP